MLQEGAVATEREAVRSNQQDGAADAYRRYQRGATTEGGVGTGLASAVAQQQRRLRRAELVAAAEDERRLTYYTVNEDQEEEAASDARASVGSYTRAHPAV